MKLVIETRIASLAIEDSTGNVESLLFALEVAVERLEAAGQAIDESRGETLLIGRAENFFVGDDTFTQLKANAAARADCRYVLGIQICERIKAVCAALAPTPANVLLGSQSTLTLEDLAPLGVLRVSAAGRSRGLQGVASAGSASACQWSLRLSR